MKPKRDTPKPARREIFVLTPEEKRTLCFVLIALLLGLATKHYRDTHPPPRLKSETNADARMTPRSVSRQTRIPKQPQPSTVQDD
ncbi:MAG TPA: hypothetical protein VGW39_00690 [Chthoniobacterales bacterium]|nr:hypothetical protein [Chthoniobacterales bacterium]